MINKGLFTSASQHWSTPKDLYDSLDAEFHFNDDPCPLHGNRWFRSMNGKAELIVIRLTAER